MRQHRVPRRRPGAATATAVHTDRAADLTTLLGSATENTDHDKVRDYVHALMKLGVAVMLVKPGAKTPFGAISDADGKQGVHTATTDTDTFDGYLDIYLDKYGPGCAINLAAATGASRLVIVDCDTAGQTDAFRTAMALDTKTPPTVTSPGTQDDDGNWIHTAGNGHFWFVVPDGVVLPTGIASMKVGGENGYDVKWGPSYALIPPSTRKEGPYTATGPVVELPNCLRDRVTQHGQLRAQRATKARTEVNSDDPIAVWSANTSWAEILEATDWINTGKSDTCGCDIWTAPGLHASEKSATAHEFGCSRWDESSDPPLYIWTTGDVEPFTATVVENGNSVTRFRAYAAIHHGGDEAAAVAVLNPLPEFGGKPKVPGNEEKGAGRQSGVGDGRPKLWWANDMRPAQPMQWLAKGNIPKSAVTLLVGEEGIGKSTLWVWLVAHVTTGKPCLEFGLPARESQHVILVITEDDWATVVRPRLAVAGTDFDYIRVCSVDDDGSGAPTFPDDLDAVSGEDTPPALVVVDAWLDTVPGKGSVKDPQYAREVLHPWKDFATRHEAAVLLLSHTNRQATPNARDKYGVTSELRKAVRQALYAQGDPEDEGCMLVGPEKGNNVATGVEATRFRIVPVQHFKPTDDNDGMVTRMECLGPAGKSSREFIADAFHRGGEDDEDIQDRATEATRWLEDFLTLHGKSPKKKVVDGARAVGIKDRTLERAAKKILVKSEPEGFPATTHWELTGGVEMSGGMAAEGGPGEG